MDPDIELFLNHVGISAKNFEKTKYAGLIFANERAFQVELNKTPANYFEATSSSSELDSFVSLLNKKQFQHPVHYLNDLQTYLLNKFPELVQTPIDIYQRVLNEYKEFKNFYIYLEHSKLFNDFSAVTITYADEKRRKHLITINVNYKETGKLFQIHAVDLPVSLQGEDDSLIKLFEEIIANFEVYQHFFDVMDQIDANCYVVDPAEPKRSDVIRRIILAKRLSVVITLNPNAPSALPDVKFLGSAHQVEGFLQKAQVNCDSWDGEGDVLEELLKLFAMDQFPKDEDQDVQIDVCSICYSLRSDNGKLIEVFCPHVPCEQCFHTECLYQWFQESCQESNNAFCGGKCPYCKLQLSL